MITQEKAQSVVKIQGLMNYRGVAFLQGMDSVSKSLTSGRAFTISKKLSEQTSENLKDIVSTERLIDSSEERVDIIKNRQERLERKQTPVGSGLSFIKNKIRSVLATPLRALELLLAGLFIQNIPALIEQVKMFARRVKLFVTQLGQYGELIVTTFRNSIAVVNALIENLNNFDFNDSEKRVQAAIRQFDQDMDEQKEDLEVLSSAWNLEETELEQFIQNLDLGLDPSEAFADIEPQETVTGDPAPSTEVESTGNITDDLFDLITSGEGDYNSINRGSAGDSPGGAKQYFGKDLTDMTVGEIMRLQAQGKLYAVGKYQIIPSTMIDFVRTMGIKSSDKFNAETQEKFKAYVIDYKRPEVGEYIRGESDDRTAAAQGLALEFASVGAAEPQTVAGFAPAERGDTLYGGQGNNAASVSPVDVEGLLDSARSNYASTGSMTTAAAPEAPSTTPTPTAGSEVISSPTSVGTLINSVDWNDAKNINGTGDVGVTALMGDGRGHQGIDIGVSGAKNYMFALKIPSKVVWVDYDSTSGHYVVVKNGAYEYAFMHLKEQVKWVVGQSIPAGVPIGIIGNTGRSRGEHLHFEVRDAGTLNRHDAYKWLHLLIIGKLTRGGAAKVSSISNMNSEALSNSLEQLFYDYDAANQQNTILIAQQPVIATQTNTIVAPGGGGGSAKPVVVVSNKKSVPFEYNTALMSSLS